MNIIFNKIENIRKQPEHIRLRWAWGLTAVAMLFVAMIWAISFSLQVSDMNSEKEAEKFKNENSPVLELQEQKKSIQDAAGQIKNILEEKPQTEDIKSLDNQ